MDWTIRYSKNAKGRWVLGRKLHFIHLCFQAVILRGVVKYHFDERLFLVSCQTWIFYVRYLTIASFPNFQGAGPTLSPVCQILTFALLKIAINWMKIYATLKSYGKGVAYPFESLFFIRVVKIFLRIDCFSAKLKLQNEVSHNGDYPYFSRAALHLIHTFSNLVIFITV